MSDVEAPSRAGAASGTGAFASFDVLARSWFVLARSKDVRRSRPVTVELHGRRIVLWRDSSGSVHAMNGRCVHLGADLGQGRVVGDQLECPLHHWRFAADGACASAPCHDEPPRRSLVTWPTLERWGLVWVFTGREPTFELPDPAGPRRLFRPPSQHILCHPHLVLGNVFDLTHFGPLHGIDFDEPPRIEQVSDHELVGYVRARFRSARIRRITGSSRSGVHATFRMFGGSVLHAQMHLPLAFDVIFTGRPSDEDGCITRTVFSLPRSPRRAVQGVLLVLALLHDDRKVMDRLQFTPAFSDGDDGLRALQRFCDSQPVAWTRRGSTGS